MEGNSSTTPPTSNTTQAANVTITLSNPRKFLPDLGEPSVKWPEWKEYFINYLATLEDNGSVLSPERKKRILMHSLGPEGLRVYCQMQKIERSGDFDVFECAIADLDDHYSPSVCVAVSRRTFYKRKQEPSESVDDFVSALKHLAIKC